MSSVHGPNFCRIQVRENIGVNIRYFVRLVQGIRSDFYRRQKIGPIPYDFYRSFTKVVAHMARFLSWTVNRRDCRIECAMLLVLYKNQTFQPTISPRLHGAGFIYIGRDGIHCSIQQSASHCCSLFSHHYIAIH